MKSSTKSLPTRTRASRASTRQSERPRKNEEKDASHSNVGHEKDESCNVIKKNTPTRPAAKSQKKRKLPISKKTMVRTTRNSNKRKAPVNDASEDEQNDDSSYGDSRTSEEELLPSKVLRKNTPRSRGNKANTPSVTAEASKTTTTTSSEPQEDMLFCVDAIRGMFQQQAELWKTQADAMLVGQQGPASVLLREPWSSLAAGPDHEAARFPYSNADADPHFGYNAVKAIRQELRAARSHRFVRGEEPPDNGESLARTAASEEDTRNLSMEL